MAYQVTALYDQESGEAPLKWGKNAVAEGEFSTNAGRVMVDDVLCTPVSWTASEVVFVPVASSRPDGNYSVHFDNEPLVLAFVTHPQDQTISATAPVNEYLHNFATGDPITLGGFNGTPADGVYTDTAHRPSLATGADDQGVVQEVIANVPAIVGGSLTGNLWSSASGTQGLQLEESRTNECLHSTDYTNAAWVKSGISVSGTQLTATGANGTITQTVTAASSERTASFYITRVSGSGTVEISSGGGTWAPVTISGTGAYYRHTSTQTNPVIGVRLGTSGDVIDLQMVSLEAGAFGTSGIVTGTSPVTRAATNCSATFAQLGDPLPAGGVTDSYSFQLVFTMLCNWGELTQYTRLFSLLPEGETPANANDRFCILQSEAGRMHFERRLNGSNKSTSRNLGSEPLKGDTVDIRVRVDSVNGFQFWLGSVKESGEDAALAGSHTVPVDSVELGRYRGHGTRNGNFIIHQFRLVPEALTDEDIEAWT